MKYKVNDRVMVKKNLKVDNCYSKVRFDKEMEDFLGKIVTIKYVNNSRKYYEINEDNERFVWGEEMFEGLAPFTKFDLKDGDICTLRNGSKGTYKKEKGVSSLSDYQIREDLTNAGSCGKELDIVKVEHPIKYETVFERKEEPKEMTLKEVCEKLGYEVKIIKED